MKFVAVILALILSAVAADLIDVGVLTDFEGIGIKHCHPGDEATIEVVPVDMKREGDGPGPLRVGGFFSTTNRIITMREPAMSMAPPGTNRAYIRTVCQGATSEVQEVLFVIRRILPAPTVSRRSVFPAVPPAPPSPAGMIVKISMPLPLPPGIPPGETYREFQQRQRAKDAVEKGRRRSQ